MTHQSERRADFVVLGNWSCAPFARCVVASPGPSCASAGRGARTVRLIAESGQDRDRAPCSAVAGDAPIVPTHYICIRRRDWREPFCAVAFENDRLGRRGPNEGFWVRENVVARRADKGCQFVLKETFRAPNCLLQETFFYYLSDRTNFLHHRLSFFRISLPWQYLTTTKKS